MVSGIQSRAIPVDGASIGSVICVPFNAGGAFCFLRCAADELKDAHVPLESLWGRAATDLRERLLDAAPADRFRVLEQSLIQQLDEDKVLHPAVRIAIREFGTAPWRTIRSVVQQVGMSERRLIQLFKQQVGTTPKQYCRIQRFQRALHRIERSGPPNWAGLALDCGYFDQSHFVNEFRALAGMSPTQYLSRTRTHRNHVIAADSTTSGGTNH
jgi:AraC-like DNA-binding protein